MKTPASTKKSRAKNIKPDTASQKNECVKKSISDTGFPTAAHSLKDLPDSVLFRSVTQTLIDYLDPSIWSIQ